MRQKPGTRGSYGGRVVKDIRRATRKQYSAEEKIWIVSDGLKGEDALPSCAAARALPRAKTIRPTPVLGTFWGIRKTKIQNII